MFSMRSGAPLTEYFQSGPYSLLVTHHFIFQNIYNREGGKINLLKIHFISKIRKLWKREDDVPYAHAKL